MDGRSVDLSQETREYLNILYDSDLNSSTSSVATDSTTSNLPGTGRVLGELLSFLGTQLEKRISKGSQDPDVVWRKIEATLQYHESSKTLLPKERERVVRDIQKLLEFTSSPFYDVQVRAFIGVIELFQGKALAFYDCLQSANYAMYFSTFPIMIKKRRGLHAYQSQNLLKLSAIASSFTKVVPQSQLLPGSLSRIQEERPASNNEGHVTFREGFTEGFTPSPTGARTRTRAGTEDPVISSTVSQTSPRGRNPRTPISNLTRFQPESLRANSLPRNTRRSRSEGPSPLPSRSTFTPTSPDQPSPSKKPRNARTTKNSKIISSTIKALNLFSPKKNRTNKKPPSLVKKTPSVQKLQDPSAIASSSRSRSVLPSSDSFFFDPSPNLSSSPPSNRVGNNLSTQSTRSPILFQTTAAEASDTDLKYVPILYPEVHHTDKRTPLARHRSASISSSNRSVAPIRRPVSPTPRQRPKSTHFEPLPGSPSTPTDLLKAVQEGSSTPPFPSIGSIMITNRQVEDSPLQVKSDLAPDDQLIAAIEPRVKDITSELLGPTVAIQAQVISLKEEEPGNVLVNQMELNITQGIPVEAPVVENDGSKVLLSAAPLNVESKKPEELLPKPQLNDSEETLVQAVSPSATAILPEKSTEAPISVPASISSSSAFLGHGIGNGWWFFAIIFIFPSKYWVIAIAVTAFAYSLGSGIGKNMPKNIESSKRTPTSGSREDLNSTDNTPP